jgi:hypothetical protein
MMLLQAQLACNFSDRFIFVQDMTSKIIWPMPCHSLKL